jgi:hypothetical protein
MNKIVLAAKETTGKMIPRKPKLYVYTGDSIKYFKDKRTSIFIAKALSDEYTFLSFESSLIYSDLVNLKNDLIIFCGTDQTISNGEFLHLEQLLNQAFEYYKKSVLKEGMIKAPAKWLLASFEKLSDACLKLFDLWDKKNNTLMRYKCKSLHIRCLSSLYHIEFLKNDMFENDSNDVNKNSSVEN